MNELDKSALINNECTIKTKIIVNDGTVLTESDYVLSWDYEDFRYVPNQGFLGQFVERVVNGKLKNVDDSFTLENKVIELQFAVVRNDGTETWYSLGHFIVNNPTDDNVKDNTSFKAVDYTKYFETPYVDNVTYPTTAGALAYSVCKQAKTSLGNFQASLTTDTTINSSKQYFTYDSTKDVYNLVVEPSASNLSNYYEMNECFTNHDFVIEANQFVSNETCREVMKAISMLAYSWVRIGWDDKCYLDFEVYNSDDIPSENVVTNDYYYELTTKNDYFGEVNKVIIGMKDVDGENTTLTESAIVWDGDTTNRESIDAQTVMFYKVSDIILSKSDLIGQRMTGSFNGEEVDVVNIEESSINDIDGVLDAFMVESHILVLQKDTSIFGEQHSSGVYFMFFPDWRMYISKVTLPSTIVVSSNESSVEITLWDNPLTYNQELREKAIVKADKLFGLKYKPVEMTTVGHPWLIGNELIEIIDMESNFFTTYPFDRTISYSGHIKTKIKSQAMSKTDTKYAYEGKLNNLDKSIKNTQIIVNKNEQQIQSIVTETDTLNDTVVELGTTIAQNKEALEISISGLTETVNSTNQNLQDEIDNINGSLTNGVETLKNSLVTININGIQVSTNTSKINSVMQNDKFAIQNSSGDDLIFIGYDEELGASVSRMDNLTVTTYFTTGYHRTEGFTDEETNEPRTGWFYVGGSI